MSKKRSKKTFWEKQEAMYGYGVTTTSLPPDSFVPTHPARYRWEFLCAGLGRIFRPPQFYNWRYWLRNPWKSLSAPFRGYRLAFQWDRVPKTRRGWVATGELFRGFTVYRLRWVLDVDDDDRTRVVESAVAGCGWIRYWDCYGK